MDWLGPVHLALALGSMVAGAVVSFTAKGTPRHRFYGRLYGFGMVGVNVTALMIYDLFGYFGPFHWAAVFSLCGVVMGWVPARRRRPKHWVEFHAWWMSGSYLGLWAAASAEVFSRVPNTPFWGGVIGGTALVAIIGSILMWRYVPRILSRFGQRPT